MPLTVKHHLSAIAFTNEDRAKNLQRITNLLTTCKVEYLTSREVGSFDVILYLIANHRIIELIICFLAGTDEELIKQEIMSYQKQKESI